MGINSPLIRAIIFASNELLSCFSLRKRRKKKKKGKRKKTARYRKVTLGVSCCPSIRNHRLDANTPPLNTLTKISFLPIFTPSHPFDGRKIKIGCFCSVADRMHPIDTIYSSSFSLSLSSSTRFDGLKEG